VASGGNGGFFALGGCLILAVGSVFVILFLFTSMAGGNISGSEEAAASTWTGSSDTVATLGAAKMPELSGKIGHEQHFRPGCEGGTHLTNEYSHPLAYISDGSCGAYGSGKKPIQEEWYFNMRWFTSSGYPDNIKHKKVIITNPVNGKRVVASVEEYGPAAYLKTRDGIVAGASPEVYNYLELANPYTKNPNDKKGFATFGLAKDQSIPLGPLN
jgi:hypothetical protein